MHKAVRLCYMKGYKILKHTFETSSTYQHLHNTTWQNATQFRDNWKYTSIPMSTLYWAHSTRRATEHYTAIRWLLMGGLLHLVQRGGAAARCTTAATEALCFCFVHPGFCPVTSVFFSLHKNTERILKKFAVSNHYHQQIKWLHFGGYWNSDEGYGIRQNTTDVSLCCHDVKQVPAPSEWFTRFNLHTKADAIADIISHWFKDFTIFKYYRF